MNILFLGTVAMDVTKGGIERVTQTLADELVSRGNKVFFMSLMDRYREGSDPAVQYFFPNTHKIYSKENEVFLKNFLAQNDINVVVFQPGDDKRVPFPHLYPPPIRLIVCVHMDPEFYRARIRNKIQLKYGSSDGFWTKLLAKSKIFLRKRKQTRIYRGHEKYAEKVVLLSPAFIPVFSKYLKNPNSNKVNAIPNLLPPASFPRAEVDFSAKKKELLWVGRMDFGEKRPDLMLKIWALLEPRFPEWSLRFLGGGNALQKLKNIAGTLNLKRVFFEGIQKPEKYYREASILCMTSSTEGFGMVLVEASAFGCVPVAFDSFAAVHDILKDGETGALVPAFDCEKYAEKLAFLMENHDARERLGKNAQENAKRFSAEHVYPLWEKLLQSLEK